MEHKIISSENGKFMISPYDSIISKELEQKKIWSKRTLEIIEQNKNLDSTMIDCGANIGTISIPMSKNCKEVYSFELSKFNFLLLCANMWLNNSMNIKPFNNILSYDDDLEYFFKEIKEGKISNFGDIRTNANGETKSLSKKIDSYNFNNPVSLMKIDCQGMDLDVLLGAEKTIKKDRPKIIFEYEKRFSKQPFSDYRCFFDRLNYSMKDIGDRDFLCESL